MILSKLTMNKLFEKIYASLAGLIIGDIMGMPSEFLTPQQIKEQFGGKVTAITMGLPAASAVLRDSLYRGADQAILVTDRRCAASDTLATSYILSCAVKKIDCDIVLCGGELYAKEKKRRQTATATQAGMA